MKSWICLLALEVCLQGAGREPMPVDFPNSAAYRWLNKPVLERRVLDDMETLAHWEAFTKGDPGLVDARVVGKVSEASRMVTEMTLTREGSRDGGQALRMRLPTRLEGPGPKSGRAWGSAGVRRRWAGEDWRGFNRLSIWIRPDCPGFYVSSLELRLYNDGAEKLPAVFGQEGETTVMLRNHEWNHVLWEIGNVARDKLTGLEISCLMSGHEPEAADQVAYDLDRLELERVEPDYVEGWAVWPGRIAYSHAGYPSGGAKSAIASGLSAREFRLIDQTTGEAVLAKPVRTVQTHLGSFQVMDFSEMRQPGSYILEAGGTVTRAFRIDPNVWRQTIWKALNFFYTERCGMEIPGVHGICHREHLQVPESRRESFRKQVLEGIPLGAGHYLRMFPVWMDYRGHFGTILPQAQALASAAHVRGDPDAARLAQHQLEWVIGRNPFAQSTMWGEGCDFPPLYTPSSGDLVGALPVGIQTRGDKDVPYWPVQSTWTYKEVWVHPVARWIWLSRDLAGPALVEGQAGATVEFQETASGQRITAQPDSATGRFRALIPEGEYTARCLGEEERRTFLPAGSYRLDLRPGRALDFEISKSASGPGDVIIRVRARGTGNHRFGIRADNLELAESQKEMILKPGLEGVLEWRGHIGSPDTPWVAVVVPDDDLALRKEVLGAVWER